jgi:hygromycin-B 4-O-kinase
MRMPRLLEIGEAFDGYFAISERARGTFLEERDAAAMQRVLPSLLTTLDRIRNTNVDGTSGFGVWHGNDGHAPYATWRESLLSIATRPPSTRMFGWRDALARSSTAQRAFDSGYAAMEPLVEACPNQRHLLHSDLLYFNVLVEDDAVSAVFDWGSSMYGDFLWDLAWMTFWQPWYAAWSRVDVRQAALEHYAAIGLDVPNFDERLRCYELAIGLDGLAYQAFAGKPSELEWTAARVQRLAGS